MSDAEFALVGAMLTGFPDCIVEAGERLSPADFTNPRCRHSFELIVRVHRAGGKVDPVVLLDKVPELTPAEVTQMQVLATGAWRQHIGIVLDAKLRRDLQMVCGLALESLHDTNPAQVLDDTRNQLSALEAPMGRIPVDAFDADALVTATKEKPPEWVLPGLMRSGWRCVIVAFEGRGKSVALSSLATGLSHGRNALTGQPCSSRPAVIIDLENPREVVAQRIRDVDNACGNDRIEPLSVWHRPAGINLRKRGDRSELNALLNAKRPALVVLGPLYKAYRPEGRERDEEAAAEAQAVLDDLRCRYGFALMMEHHAPHAEGGSRRTPRPFGSSLWLRWPELGLALEDSKDRRGSLDVTRWRGDRVKAAWPDRLDRGKGFPWSGWWRDGYETGAA